VVETLGLNSGHFTFGVVEAPDFSPGSAAFRPCEDETSFVCRGALAPEVDIQWFVASDLLA